MRIILENSRFEHGAEKIPRRNSGTAAMMFVRRQALCVERAQDLGTYANSILSTNYSFNYSFNDSMAAIRHLDTDAESVRASLLRRAISNGPRPVDELISQLHTSQATLSRTIQKLGTEVISFREPGIRTPRYALLRNEPVPSPQPVFRIDENGRVSEIGKVYFVQGGGTWVDFGKARDRSRFNRFHEGLPPAMAFAAPSGYLGVRIAKAVSAALGIPSSHRDWSDDHRIKFLCTAGADVAGALMWGQPSFVTHMEARRAAPIRGADIPRAYRELASATHQAGAVSSAGGEQPKFTCETEERGHLIVKFARAGTRSSEMLTLEALALAALNAAGVEAAAARYVEGGESSASGDLAFLEISRFDRVGRFGRRSMISAGAIDDDLFGLRDNWPSFAQRCQLAGLLDTQAVQRVQVLTAFSELIGNRDRHFENLSLMTDEFGHPTGISPAYDMLPMMYAPLGGGIEPELEPVAPSFESLGVQPAVWTQAF
jgi:hypothetical protein